MEPLLYIALALLVVVVILLLILLSRRTGEQFAQPLARLDALDRDFHRIESVTREEASSQRAEISQASKDLRGEVVTQLKTTGDSLTQNLTLVTENQRKELETFGKNLNSLSSSIEKSLESVRETIERQLTLLRDSIASRLDQIRTDSTDSALALKNDVTETVQKLSDANEKRLESLRTTVDDKLNLIQRDTAKKLDEMRETVDGKLHEMLDKKLGDSFQRVSERLELVHAGLGEMRNLATGVGDLKKVFANVKMRGGWGEVQLGNLLDQVLTQEQYEKNVRVKKGSNESVEFAIKLPGKEDDASEPVWLPIDAKFPQEDYTRLLEAQEAADLGAIESAIKALEQRIKQSGKDICTKYRNPPATTDFAIMFLPTEGLYAEVIRRTGLVESLQRECRVIVAGPTTLAAILNSLQMGFRTLAIEKSASKVWTVLGQVKHEFGKFAAVIEKVHDKLEATSKELDNVRTRQRVMNKRLRDVQELPAADSVLRMSGPDGVLAEAGDSLLHLGEADEVDDPE